MSLWRSFAVISLFIFGAFSSPSTLSHRNSLTSVCENLASALPGKVSFPNSTAYDKSVASYFFLEESLHPGCIVSPKATGDVVSFLKVIKTCGSQPACRFAVRGGGMVANTGAAAISNGVTVDLSALNTLSLNDDSSVLSAGAGATWGQVYTYLDPRNLGVVGSRVSSSGLGGSLTGGGLSFFSPRRGFSCDSVRNAEVVLASGQVLDVSSESHPDLYRALKGGSNNFGIVTRFDLDTFSQGLYWGGAIEYPESADGAQLTALDEFHDPQKYDPDAESELSFLYSSSEDSFTSANVMYYAKPIVNASGLGPFIRVMPQTLNTMRISNSGTFAEEVYKLSPKRTYGILATFSFQLSHSLSTQMHSIWKNSTRTLQHVANLTYHLGFQGVPAATPGSNNSLGAPAAVADMVMLLLNSYWTVESDSTAVVNATRSVFDQCWAAAARAGSLLEWQYINYAAPWQRPIAGYGEANVDFLKDVAATYDPTGMFQTQVPGGFKLYE